MKTHSQICDLMHMNIPADPERQTRMESAILETWASREGKPFKGVCWVCGCFIPKDEAFEVFGNTSFTNNCNKCQPIVDEHMAYMEGKPSTAISRWELECPKLFKNIVNKPEPGTGINWDSYHQVEKWTENRRGLYITGPSGSGKTASIWALYKNLEQSSTETTLTASTALSMTLSKAAKNMDNSDIDKLSTVPVLMIDDLGKEKFNETTTTKLFEVINRRYQELLPLIVTSRYTGKKLEERFEVSQDKNLAKDISRRIGESVKPLKF